MKKILIAGAAFAAVLALIAVTVGVLVLQRGARPVPAASPATPSSPSPAAPATQAATQTQPGATTDQGFLYGRVTTADGAVHEGRLRWGGDQEASWGDYFNGTKKQSPWAIHAPKQRRPVEVFGVKVAYSVREMDVGRLFMARFGDIARVEAHGRDVRVFLKSGTVFDLWRFEASDFDDGVRVWNGKGEAVDLDSMQIRAIEFLPSPSAGSGLYRLHGTVRTPQREFTGFLQWDREKGIGADELVGHTKDGEQRLHFDTIRSVARRSGHGVLVGLLDGREMELASVRNRGIYVDDPRYGRVLVSWEAFARADFDAAGSGPAYGDFPPGRPLRGTVTTRGGGRFTGRLVYDLDESETTETLDAPSQDVDFTIPFGLVASIALPGSEGATVTLHDGEVLPFERSSDLGEGNAGMLIFVDGREKPEYVPWADVAQVDFDPPPAP